MEERRINKPIVIILTVFLVLLCIFAFLYHSKVYTPKLESIKNQQTTYEVGNKEPVKAGERVLLAEVAEADIQLYKDGDYVILVHEGRENEYTNWNRHIGEKPTEMYYYDFNEDEKNDIVIRAYEGDDDITGESVYGLYVIFINKDADGNYIYNVNYTNSDEWAFVFNSIITCRLNQLISTPKRIQFTMEYADMPIIFDEKTGLVTGDAHAWYILAPTAPSGEYCTLKSWEKGACVITIDPETMETTVDTAIYISYNETDKIQTAGKMRCRLSFKDGKYSIGERSIVFRVNDEAVTPSPLADIAEPWSTTFRNPGGMQSGNVINNLALYCLFNYNKIDKVYDLQPYSGYKNEAAGVDRLVINESEVKIYLKSGFSFSEDATKLPNFKVLINYSNKEYDIAQSAVITKENGREVLTIAFDRTYTKVQANLFKVIIGNN